MYKLYILTLLVWQQSYLDKLCNHFKTSCKQKRHKNWVTRKITFLYLKHHSMWKNMRGWVY